MSGQRATWLLMACTMLLALVTLTLWLHGRSALPEGRFSSQGLLLLDDGSQVKISHVIQFDGDRYYSFTRQQGVVVESSGTVESTRPGYYLLRVESGALHEIGATTDDHSLFDLLYGRRHNTLIHLTVIDDCLHAVETSQLYCTD